MTNTSTLTKRLNLLLSHELLHKVKRDYHLTEKGRKFSQLLIEASTILEFPSRVTNSWERIPNVHILDLLRNFVEILRKYYPNRLLCVILFGSCARGDWTEDSDIDLMIIVKGWKIPTWERTRELIPLKKILTSKESFLSLWSKKYYFPLAIYPLSDTDLIRSHPIMYDLVLDGIVLFEENNFGKELLRQYREELDAKNAVRITQPGKQRYWLIDRQFPR